MNKKLLLVVVLVLAVVAVAYYMKMDKAGTDGMGGPGGNGEETVETTAKAGTYSCEGGKTFTLTVMGDGTARVTGAASANVVLKKSSAGIWISDDAKVSVREIAGYTALIENDVTTRDNCTKR